MNDQIWISILMVVIFSFTSGVVVACAISVWAGERRTKRRHWKESRKKTR